MRDDAEARQVVDGTMTALALRERPCAYIPDDDAMRCPWCGHLPTNEGADVFYLFSDALGIAWARIGRVKVAEGEEGEDDGRRLLIGEDELMDEAWSDVRLVCPSPGCGKSFTTPEELDFASIPDFEDRSPDRTL